MSPNYRGLMDAPARRDVFISYHHGKDQGYYDSLSKWFSATYGVIGDGSLDEPIDSDDTDYVRQAIREKYITGTSCTIVLCGAETASRKYVDWEIKATLDKQHGLVGINIPTNPVTPNGKYVVPNRLHDNIQSGYAMWIQWSDLKSVDYLKQVVDMAVSKPKEFIRNSRELMGRNR